MAVIVEYKEMGALTTTTTSTEKIKEHFVPSGFALALIVISANVLGSANIVRKEREYHISNNCIGLLKWADNLISSWCWLNRIK